MENLQFNGLPQDIHHCTSSRDGDWIVWQCPHCVGYQRRFNWVTGEMRVKRAGSIARHAALDDHREPGDLINLDVCLN